MSSRNRWWSDPWVAWTLGLTAIALMIAHLVLMYVDRNATLPLEGDGWTLPNEFDILVNFGVPILGILIASRRRENPIGWILLGAGLALGVTGFSRAYALHTLVADPGSLPCGRCFGWIANAVWPIPVSLLPLLFLLFPNGHLPSPRWRPVMWFAIGVLVLLPITTAIFATSIWTKPFTEVERASAAPFQSVALTLFVIAIFALPVATFASFASVAVRFRNSVGEERLQLKWFVTAALFVAVTFTATILTNLAFVNVAFDVALIFLYVAIGIAILKHRLYDIDVLINKAVVYALLAAFITVVYVAVVVVIGAFVGATQFLSLVATAFVAIAFQPVRDRAKRAANRVIYGKRATPYEVLSGFSEHVSETFAGEHLMPRMARLLAEGTGARDATVWLRVGSEMRPAASWPTPTHVRTSVASNGDTLPMFPDVDDAVPVQHGSELLGALTVTKQPNEPVLMEEHKLLTDLAAQVGLVLENFRLIEDLRSSRQRLVAAQDEGRRRLERNIHDGAQQQLVALAVKIRLAEGLVGTDQERERQALQAILADAQEALENLRDLARGIYPPLLADRGLSEALEAQARKVPIPVTIDHEGLGRFPKEVESAVYFSVLEALQNVAKYAEASAVVVRLRRDADDLTFSITDDGRGFAMDTTAYGMGLQNIADRLAALDGSFDVRSAPGAGTVVSGRVPLA